MASPLWQSYQDPATRDLIEMLQHAARAGDVAAQQQLETMMTGPANPNMITPSYTGATVPGRAEVTRPVGVTDADVYAMTNPQLSRGESVNVVPRQVTRQFYDPEARRPNLYNQPRVARSLPLEMGFASGVGQEEGGMEEPYLGWRPTGTFLQTYPKLRKGYSYGPEVVPPSVDISDKSKEGPTKGIEAEEGPSSWWETALEMMQAAGQEMGDEKGTAFQAGGGTGQYPGPYMTGPATIMGFAPTYLRKRKKEERYE